MGGPADARADATEVLAKAVGPPAGKVRRRPPIFDPERDPGDCGREGQPSRPGRAGDREPPVAVGEEPAPDHWGFVGDSAAMRRLRAFIRRIAPSNAVVLVTGETGTGKECVARLIHRLSRRAQGPLVAVNCAAIPDSLIEGELFGYERGAFTGAARAYPGKLKLADGGTLLLDEVSELSASGQAKALRAIETREAYRLGARTPARFDARLVAATNRNLEREADAGRFRRDLYYRLAVAQIRVPPLRERIEDVAPIARYLLAGLARAADRPGAWLDEGALDRLAGHDWPGNVRELRNVIEVALVLARGPRIRASDLPAGIAAGRPSTRPAADQRARLLAALARARGNKSLAAQDLACSRMTLYRWMARHGIATDDPAVTVSQTV